MRNLKIFVIGFILFVFTSLFSQERTKISDILSNPDKYDKKEVIVEGKVDNLKFKTSKKGNQYITFSIKDEENNSLKVFSWGHQKVKEEKIEDGDKVEVSGIFYKVKFVGQYRFYNEIEAEKIEKLKK